MRRVTDKIETLRIAEGEGGLRARAKTLKRLQANDLPKKDALAVARTAGIMAAKRTHEIIPFCHALPIEAVSLDLTCHRDRVRIRARVEAVAKTGVEMEALTAVAVTALTLYDMLKPIDDSLEILSTKLLEKRGGKSDFTEALPKGFKAAVVVTSDGTAKGKRRDKSGQLARERLEAYGIPVNYMVLPDDHDVILKTIKKLCRQRTSLILTAGGTGLGPRDVTVEATRKIIETEVPGIMEAARSYGQRRTPYAMLSRGLAGRKGDSLIVNLPGSSKGVEESLNAIFPAILHSFQMMRGKGH